MLLVVLLHLCSGLLCSWVAQPGSPYLDTVPGTHLDNLLAVVESWELGGQQGESSAFLYGICADRAPPPFFSRGAASPRLHRSGSVSFCKQVALCLTLGSVPSCSRCEMLFLPCLLTKGSFQAALCVSR